MFVLQIVLASFLVAAAMAQQRPVPPAFTRSGVAGRFNLPLELEPNQQVPQPFRRVSVPLYRGRGFSLDGQEPKSELQVPQQTFLQPRPTALPNENPEFSRVGNNNAEENAADNPQPTRQVPQLQQQQHADRSQLQAERFQQQQQHQQIDRIQQQQQHTDKTQHEKQFPNFRPQVKMTLLYARMWAPGFGIVTWAVSCLYTGQLGTTAPERWDSGGARTLRKKC